MMPEPFRSSSASTSRSLARRLRASMRPHFTACVFLTVVAGLLGISGCEEVEQLRDHFRDLTPHETYQAQLNVAGLGGSALARDWETAGRRALAEPLSVTLPYAEEGYISPDAPEATGYRFRLERGRKLTVEVSVESGEPARVFVDLFRVPADPADPMRPVFSSESPVDVFSHEPWRGGEFVLRLQPELLRGGSYSVSLQIQAQLVFPVEGHGSEYIYSWFGAPRDGGCALRLRNSSSTPDAWADGTGCATQESGCGRRRVRGGDVVRELDRHTPLRVLAGSGSFFRARLPDGTTGYVAARLTEPVAAPFSTETVAAARAVLAAPMDDSAVLARLGGGNRSAGPWPLRRLPVRADGGRADRLAWARDDGRGVGFRAQPPDDARARISARRISMTPRPGSAASSSASRSPRSVSASA